MQEHFLEKGWLVLDCLDPGPIYETREFLEKTLSDYLGKAACLEQYHMESISDSLHTEIQIKLTEAYRKNKLGPTIIKKQLPLFIDLLGPDLFVQADPYLRITRPGKPQDNIGYHRDTFYGGSPYELSVLVPFVDVDSKSALHVLSGSHIQAEDVYPTHQVVDQEVTKGSDKHQLGFLYAPKLMDDAIESKMEPIPLKLGQMLVFSLSTVHGSRVNLGSASRWSSDIRVMNAMAPVDLTARPTYYQSLSQSIVTQSARKYFYGEKERKSVELGICNTASRE